MTAAKNLEEIWAALRSADAAKARELLADGTVAQLASRVHGGTLVHLAGAAGRADLLTALVKAGADVDAKDRYGWTPIRAAFQADVALQQMADTSADANFDRVRNVLLAGGDPNIADQDGKTVWQLASAQGPQTVMLFHQTIAALDAKAAKRLRGTDGDTGTVFWISEHDVVNPEGYGVTAFSLDEAIRMVRSFKLELSEDQSKLTILKGATAADITDPAVRAKMGPMKPRGMWYPYIWQGLPPWMKS